MDNIPPKIVLFEGQGINESIFNYEVGKTYTFKRPISTSLNPQVAFTFLHPYGKGNLVKYTVKSKVKGVLMKKSFDGNYHGSNQYEQEILLRNNVKIFVKSIKKVKIMKRSLLRYLSFGGITEANLVEVDIIGTDE